MSVETEILKALGRFVDNRIPDKDIVCTVSSVDTGELTCVCSPVNGNADIIDVRLMTIAGNGFLIIPAVNSKVTVSFLDNSSGYVSQFSTVTEIQLNGDTYSGLVKIADLVTKLNNLENKVNDLITAMNTHVHTGVTTGAGSSAIGTVPIVGALTPTVQANLENTTVKHGNGT